MNIPQINIMAMIDVIGSLSDNKLRGNIFMMDNSRSHDTTGQGTGVLSTVVQFGQVINWHILPIDVQTEVRVNKIIWQDDVNPCLKVQEYGLPGSMPPYYAGIVKLDAANPIPGVPDSEMVKTGIYHYNLEVIMSGKTMTMTTNPSLNIRAPKWNSRER